MPNKYLRAHSSLCLFATPREKCTGNLVLYILEYGGIVFLYYYTIPVSEVNMSSRKITPKKLKVREQLEAEKNDLDSSKDRRLQEECEKAEYRPPCHGEQVGERKRGTSGFPHSLRKVHISS